MVDTQEIKIKQWSEMNSSNHQRSPFETEMNKTMNQELEGPREGKSRRRMSLNGNENAETIENSPVKEVKVRRQSKQLLN